MILDIKDLMDIKGFSSAELAEELEISAQAMSSITQGKSLPRYKVLEKLAEELDVQIGDLFYSKRNKPNNTDSLNGFIEFEGKIHKINSFEELSKLIVLIDQEINNRNSV